MRLLVPFVLYWVCWSTVAVACTCGSSGGCVVSGREGAPIFVGTVLAVEDVPAVERRAFLSHRRVRLRVDEAFGGLDAGVRELTLLTGLGNGDCGIPFRAGEAWLVAAFTAEDGVLHAGLCSDTCRLAFAGAKLEVLRRCRDGLPVPSLVGQIARVERNFQDTWRGLPPKALAGAVVRVVSDGKPYEAKADDAGVFAFFHLPAGRYRFAPEVGPGGALAWYVDSEEPDRAFELGDGGCVERDARVYSTGAIEGRLMDTAGRAVGSQRVYILPAEQALPVPSRRSYKEWTDRDGRFRFFHLPAGEYQILVNPENARDPEFPYGRTFYPGVAERGAAGVITVAEGQEVRGVELRLDPLFAPRPIVVHVAWPDGEAVRDEFAVTAAAVSGGEAAEVSANVPEDKGLARLLLAPAESYAVTARMFCEYGSGGGINFVPNVHSNTIHVSPGDGRAEISLRMQVPGCPEMAGWKLLTVRRTAPGK